jgi:hypothetical protein
MMIKDLEMRKDLASEELSAVRGGSYDSIAQYGPIVSNSAEGNGAFVNVASQTFNGGQYAELHDVNKSVTKSVTKNSVEFEHPYYRGPWLAY